MPFHLSSPQFRVLLSPDTASPVGAYHVVKLAPIGLAPIRVKNIIVDIVATPPNPQHVHSCAPAPDEEFTGRDAIATVSSDPLDSPVEIPMGKV